MQAINPEIVSVIMHRNDLPSNKKESKVSLVSLEAINKVDSVEEIDQIPSMDRYIPDIQQQISLKNTIKKKYRKCECISKTATAAGCAATTGTGLAALGLCIASLAIPHTALCSYSAFTYGGFVVGAFTTVCSFWVSEDISHFTKTLEDEEISLQEAIERLKNKNYVSFIDSQEYENLEDLLTLPNFHRYVEVCLKIQKEWALQKTQKSYPYSRKTLETMLILREREEILGNAIFKTLHGNFKRFDFHKEK